jgi:hypothetical protein
MRRQFAIELCVDYEDPDKNDIICRACQAAARYVYATAALLQDGIKPEIAISSDDFMSGYQQIALLDDTEQQGPHMLGRVEEEPASEDLLTALRETK